MSAAKARQARTLPANASLEHLKKDAKDRLAVLRRHKPDIRLAEAQHQLACEYGFASWRALKASVEQRGAAFPTADEVGLKRAEQSLPRTAIAFDPKRFDKFTGVYQFGTRLITISRKAKHFFLQATGQPQVEIFPESERKFFTKVTPLQISFDAAAEALLLHQAGHEYPASRIDAQKAQAFEAALAQRLAHNTPDPTTEPALRHHIAQLWRGRPAYGEMTPALAATVNQQLPIIREYVKKWGNLKSVSFQNVTVGGTDVYEVQFEHANTEWRLNPVRDDGRIGALGMRELP